MKMKNKIHYWKTKQIPMLKLDIYSLQLVLQQNRMRKMFKIPNFINGNMPKFYKLYSHMLKTTIDLHKQRGLYNTEKQKKQCVQIASYLWLQNEYGKQLHRKKVKLNQINQKIKQYKILK